MAMPLPQALFTSYPLPGGKEVLVNKEAVVVVILQESAGLTVQGVRQHPGQGEDIADIRHWQTSTLAEEEKQLFPFDQCKLLTLLSQFGWNPNRQIWVIHNQLESQMGTRIMLVLTTVIKNRVESVHGFLGHVGKAATDRCPPAQEDAYQPCVQAGAPFQVWGTDILGAMRVSSRGNQVLLILKDVSSKWLEIVPMAVSTSKRVFRAHHLYSWFLQSPQVPPDNATNSKSHMMPETSQQARQLHWDLHSMFWGFIQQYQARWEEVREHLSSNISADTQYGEFREVQIIISAEEGEKIWIKSEGQVNQCGLVAMRIHVPRIFLYPMIKEGVHCCPAKGLWDSLSTREIHHCGVVFHKCSMNQKEPISPVPSEFAAIFCQDCHHLQEAMKEAPSSNKACMVTNPFSSKMANLLPGLERPIAGTVVKPE